MKRPKTTLILTWLMVAYCYLPVYAEAPVESVRRKAPASGQKLTVGDRLTKLERQQKSNNIKSLIDRLDQLEGHVATLEGKLSEANHQINTLKQEQIAWAKSIDHQLSDKQRVSLREQDQAEEIKLYESALSAIKQKKYQQAVEDLELFVEKYPNSKHVANSYYWMAESHLLLQHYQASEDALHHILKHYPEHIKIPDVIYKLVMLYSHKNEPDKAKAHYKKLARSYSQSPAFVAAKKQFSHFDT
ncbi:MAG: hypothetical protein CMF46_04770 [Legionellales bacterium]|nr:hypothetical protein [Legionellales bacterium]|tara:strand:- start:2206 stop:2940 length:735 start_codon:yes stop_codon:yes gene_type:complete